MAGTGVILPAVALGLQAFSSISEGIAGSQANQHSARQAETAARVGHIQADQIDATARTELSTTISNIRAIAATAGAPIDSQALQAFISGEERASDRDRRIAVSGARLQAGQSSLDALAYRRAARWSLIGGFMGAATSIAKIPGTFPSAP
jgi:hypothetical protein